MEYRRYLKVSFKLICLLLVGISICSLFHTWLENNDASSIGFKYYNDKEQDVYPTFSFCFRSIENGALFTHFETELMKKFLLRPTDFEILLKGYEINDDNSGYSDFQNISGIEYDQYMIKLEDIVLALQFLTTDDQDDYTYDNVHGDANITGNDQEWRFYISHVDPTTVCFSRKSKYVQNLIRKSDAVLLSIEKMKEWNKFLYLHVYVHHPGQLIRFLDKPIFNTWLQTIDQYNNDIRFSISQVNVLRKRANANFPCDPKLHDDESNYKKVVIERAGCTPNYWGTVMETKRVFEMCTSSSQMRSIYHDITGFRKVLGTYNPPCNEMRISTSLQRRPYYMNESLYLLFNYMDENYQEIVNFRAFTISSFFSDTGGFIGMILGYSLLQIPAEIVQFWEWFCDRKRLGGVPAAVA